MIWICFTCWEVIFFCWPWWPLKLKSSDRCIDAGSHVTNSLASSSGGKICEALNASGCIFWNNYSSVFQRSWKKKFCDISEACCASAVWKVLTKFLVVSAWLLVHIWKVLHRVWLFSDSCWLIKRGKTLKNFHLFLKSLNGHLIESEILWHDSALFSLGSAIHGLFDVLQYCAING